jgi:hypothetical protein
MSAGCLDRAYRLDLLDHRHAPARSPAHKLDAKASKSRCVIDNPSYRRLAAGKAKEKPFVIIGTARILQ